MAGTTTNNGWTYPTSTDYVYQGASAIQTLASGIDTSVGTGLLAWQSWSPAFSGGWANGNGTWTATYVKIGKTVHWRAFFVLGSTTTKGTSMLVSLPVTAAYVNSTVSSSCLLVTGSSRYAGVVIPNTTGTISVQTSVASATYTTANAITSTTPFTWATGDSVMLAGTYEAA